MECFKTLPFFCDSLTVAVEGTMILQNLRNYTSNDTAPRLWRLASSTSALWGTLNLTTMPSGESKSECPNYEPTAWFPYWVRCKPFQIQNVCNESDTPPATYSVHRNSVTAPFMYCPCLQGTRTVRQTTWQHTQLTSSSCMLVHECTVTETSIFRRFCKISKSDYQHRLVCPSVRPSAWYNSAPTGRISTKFDIWLFFENLSRKCRFY